MAVVGDVLFYRNDQIGLDDALRHQANLLREKVDALEDNLFSAKSDDEIAELIAKENAIEPLVVDFGAAKANVQETQVDVHDKFNYGRGHARIQGLLATKSIPFQGDPELWRLRTNPYNLNPPRGNVNGNLLIIGISVPTEQADEAARYLDETITKIPEYLRRQEAQINQHNASIAGHALQWIKRRRERLGSASDLLKKIGG